MTLRAALVLVSSLAALLASTSAAAQSRVVVMGSPATRDGIATALRIELAHRGTTVVVTDPPLGDTRVARAASAQASARASGADAAVWVDTVDAGGGAVLSVHVAPATDTDARDAPLGTDADARDVAVVAASLLGELLGPPEPPATPHVDVDVHTTVDVHVGNGAAASTPATALASPAWLPRAPEAPLRTAPETPRAPSDMDFGASLGGLTFINDRSSDPGLVLRGTVGWAVGDLVRIGADAEVAAINDSYNGGSAIQPTVRVGPSVELVLPLGLSSVRIGAHVRGVMSSTWEYIPMPIDSLPAESKLAWGVSAGGSIAACLAFDAHTWFDIRLELDGMARDAAGRTPWFVPALYLGVIWS